jgi:hypothetical protein
MRAFFILLLALAGCTAGVADAKPVATTSGPVLAQPDTTTPSASRPGVRVRGHARTYAVVLVAPGDRLPLRAAPSVDAAIVGELEDTASGVVATGVVEHVHGTIWREVVAGNGAMGWVDARFLTEDVSPDVFCDSADSQDVLRALGQALDTADGAELFGLVSPIHGLRVRYLREGDTVVIDDSEMPAAITGELSSSWGVDPISGETVEGTFADLVAPELADAIAEAENFACNRIVTQPATYVAELPSGWHAVNFFTIELLPSTEGAYDWASWVVGIEYVEDQPYLFSLARFGWEP